MSDANNDTKAGPTEDKKSKKGLYLKIAYVFIAIVLVVGGVYLIKTHKSKKNKATEKARYDLMVKNVSQATSVNDKYKAKNIVETYLKDPPENKQYLYSAEIWLTTVCISLNNYTCANDAASKALKVGLYSNDWGLYQNLGDINSKTGKYDKAVEFYNKAIEILNKQPQFIAKEARINDLKGKIFYVNNVLRKK